MSFAGAGVLRDSPVIPQEVTQVFPPQVLETRLEEGERVGAPVRRDVLGDDSHSDVVRLHDLRDVQEWGAHKEAILRMGAPSFVPGSQRPVNFMS